MKGIIDKRDGRWVIVYTKRKRDGMSLAPYSYVKVESIVPVLGRQYDLCEIGKAVLFTFYGSKANPFGLIDDSTLYSKIEHAIISWNIDGTKTAGTLTREVLSILKKDKSMFVTKTNAIKALKHVRNECMDEDKCGDFTDKMLKNTLEYQSIT